MLHHEMRTAREAAKLSLRETARRMGVSAPYLSDLELNRRHITAKAEAKFNEAIKVPASITNTMTDFQALTYAIDLCDRYGNEALQRTLDPELALSRDGLREIVNTAVAAGTRLRELRHLHETPLSLTQTKQQ